MIDRYKLSADKKNLYIKRLENIRQNCIFAKMILRLTINTNSFR